MVALLAIVGLGLWATIGLAYLGETSAAIAGAIAFVIAFVVGKLASPSPALLELIDRLRHPTARAAFLTAIVVGLLATAYVGFVAWWQHRSLMPTVSDEYAYLTSAQILARGRLWMPPHPLGPFFESFQIITKPVYASTYFPGNGLFFVPAVWLGVPFWVVTLVVAGAVATLTYHVISELFDDGLLGLMAVVLMTSQGMFRTLAFSALAQLPTLLLGLTLVWLWLRWRHRQTAWPLALGMGVVAGWCAVTRPVDALCFVVPVTFAVVTDLVKARRPGVAVATLVMGVLGALPFAGAQLAFNRAASGSWATTPFAVTADRDYPGTSFGFHAFDPTTRPLNGLPQAQDQYDKWVAPKVQSHRSEDLFDVWTSFRLPATLLYTLPNPLLIALLPLGFLSLKTRGRWVVVMGLPLFVGLYACYTFFLFHYPIPMMPAALVLVVGAVVVVRDNVPRVGGALAGALGTAMVVLAVRSAPPLSTTVASDRMFDTPTLDALEERLRAGDVQSPAVVLVRYTRGAGGSPHEEPVYNFSTAWPDDAAIIRAHDLGDRNHELFEYYAARQPDRNVYRFDRRDARFEFLGKVDSMKLQKR